MSLASDATFAKIEARVAKIDPNNREIENNNSYKFNITIDGAVKKTWSKFFESLNVLNKFFL